MDQKDYIIHRFEDLCRDLTDKLKGALKSTWKALKGMNADPKHYQKIGKALFYMANQLEREGEKWLRMK